MVTYGVPFLPGSMFLFAYLGDVPVMGLPGAVMWEKETVFDHVLPRVLAGERLSQGRLRPHGPRRAAAEIDIGTTGEARRVLELQIPGRETLRLAHLVLDYNGTLARDGACCGRGWRSASGSWPAHLQVHVITADTFGSARKETAGLPVILQIIGQGGQTEAKAELVETLGPASVAAVGNGANDRLMLARAALSICVLEAEGAAAATLMAADVVVRSPEDALDLLLRPGRLAATLRI